MKHGFVKTAAITPRIRVADPEYNADQIIELMTEASKNGAKVIVFPELCLTGYTCGDLFFQESLFFYSLASLFPRFRKYPYIMAAAVKSIKPDV